MSSSDSVTPANATPPPTEDIFTNPRQKLTEDYLRGIFS